MAYQDRAQKRQLIYVYELLNSMMSQKSWKDEVKKLKPTHTGKRQKICCPNISNIYRDVYVRERDCSACRSFFGNCWKKSESFRTKRCSRKKFADSKRNQCSKN